MPVPYAQGRLLMPSATAASLLRSRLRLPTKHLKRSSESGSKEPPGNALSSFLWFLLSTVLLFTLRSRSQILDLDSSSRVSIGAKELLGAEYYPLRLDLLKPLLKG